jgi:hypothetical protein
LNVEKCFIDIKDDQWKSGHGVGSNFVSPVLKSTWSGLRIAWADGLVLVTTPSHHQRSSPAKARKVQSNLPSERLCD